MGPGSYTSCACCGGVWALFGVSSSPLRKHSDWITRCPGERLENLKTTSYQYDDGTTLFSTCTAQNGLRKGRVGGFLSSFLSFLSIFLSFFLPSISPVFLFLLCLCLFSLCLSFSFLLVLPLFSSFFFDSLLSSFFLSSIHSFCFLLFFPFFLLFLSAFLLLLSLVLPYFPPLLEAALSCLFLIHSFILLFFRSGSFCCSFSLSVCLSPQIDLSKPGKYET